MGLDKILVIIDPTREPQPAYERALDSARQTGARLHLYLCLDAGSEEGDYDALQQRYQELLDGLASRARDDGLDVEAQLDCGEDWSQRAVSAAAQCSASMIFKNSFEHSDAERELRPTSDWTLLRLSPCPVLMVKDFRDWQHRRVLAAINSQTADQAHIKLNNQIISFARRMSEAYGSDAHFVNAFRNLNYPPSRVDLAAQCGVPEDHIHIRNGAPAAVISAVSAELEADLVIIGTVGRDGLKGRVVGNTSERLLDHTEADVLVLN